MVELNMTNQAEVVVLVAESELLVMGISTLRTSDCGRVVKRGHQKCLLTGEVKATENTNKDQTTRHKKVKTMALILC